MGKEKSSVTFHKKDMALFKLSSLEEEEKEGRRWWLRWYWGHRREYQWSLIRVQGKDRHASTHIFQYNNFIKKRRRRNISTYITWMAYLVFSSTVWTIRLLELKVLIDYNKGTTIRRLSRFRNHTTISDSDLFCWEKIAECIHDLNIQFKSTWLTYMWINLLLLLPKKKKKKQFESILGRAGERLQTLGHSKPEIAAISGKRGDPRAFEIIVMNIYIYECACVCILP